MAHQFFFNPYILDNLPAPSTGFDVVQDLSEPNLRLYITSHGVKSFFVRKRIHGKDKRIIIGNYPDMDIETARDKVSVVLENAKIKRVVRHKKINFKKFVNLYIVNRVRRSGTSLDKLERSINRHLSSLFDKNVSDISERDLIDVVASIDGQTIAGRMQELLQSMFNYAVENGYAKNNPIINLPKIKPVRRLRPLNKTGLQKLVTVIKKEENEVIRTAFLMLVYGFAPKSKIFSMQWSDLDFNHYMWCDRPLTDAAVVALQDLPQDGRWVFPGRGRGHLTDPRLAWQRVAKRAGISNLTMDDVYKFLSRQLIWASDKEDFRTNMNKVLEDLML